MRQILIILFLIWWNIPGSYAQDNFTLSLELVKPSGKLDGKSYFLARLKNHNDSLSFFVRYGGNGFGDGRFIQSFLRVIYDKIGESEDISAKKPFFNYGNEKYILIRPKAEYQVKLPCFVPIDYEGREFGILPLTQFLQKIQRVRIKLEKFQFTAMNPEVADPKPLYPQKSIDLYSKLDKYRWKGIHAPIGRKINKSSVNDSNSI